MKKTFNIFKVFLVTTMVGFAFTLLAEECSSNCSTSSDQLMKTQTSNVDEKYIREKVSQYSNLSKKEMMSKLFSEVSNLKQSGNFNFEKISGMAENVKSYLTTEQQKSLENLLKQIR